MPWLPGGAPQNEGVRRRSDPSPPPSGRPGEIGRGLLAGSRRILKRTGRSHEDGASIGRARGHPARRDVRVGSVRSADEAADRAVGLARPGIELEVGGAAVGAAIGLRGGGGAATQASHGRGASGDGRLGGTGHHGCWLRCFLARRHRGMGDRLRGRGSLRSPIPAGSAGLGCLRVVAGSAYRAL